MTDTSTRRGEAARSGKEEGEEERGNGEANIVR